jgi:hypothetical protein
LTNSLLNINTSSVNNTFFWETYRLNFFFNFFFLKDYTSSSLRVKSINAKDSKFKINFFI